MLGGLLSRVLLLAFGYAYPAYECYKTVELNKPEIEQLIFWCQYWILVALLTVLERFGDASISWLPLYSEAKLMFFIYLWCPRTKGTTYVYETFFRPYISQHENDIDRNILEFRARASDMLIVYWQKSATLGQNTFFNILKYFAAQSPSQLSRTHPSQPKKQQKSQPQEQQQVPQKQPTTLRRAASAAARQAAVTQQSQETQTAPSTSKIRRLTTSKSAPVAPTKSIPVANTAKLAEETKTNRVKLAAEDAPAPANNADAPIYDTDASPLPEAEMDDMVIDEGNVAIEDITGLDATPEKTPMEEAIRVTRARLRRRVATGTTAAASIPAVN
ncbi:HVA22-like protein i isoform X2 [Phragmites australis]|uniref:HVA22-like protein i isoform X2 n=1 Tax=Phragmites australis TaxID=29695 RepID=UPI002D78D8CA|nr:HVA22-like protein i isoform X2 [Phragmites australis]